MLASCFDIGLILMCSLCNELSLECYKCVMTLEALSCSLFRPLVRQWCRADSRAQGSDIV